MYAAAAGAAAAQAAYALPHMQTMANTGNIQQTGTQILTQASPVPTSTPTSSEVREMTLSLRGVSTPLIILESTRIVSRETREII